MTENQDTPAANGLRSVDTTSLIDVWEEQAAGEPAAAAVATKPKRARAAKATVDNALAAREQADIEAVAVTDVPQRPRKKATKAETISETSEVVIAADPKPEKPKRKAKETAPVLQPAVEATVATVQSVPAVAAAQPRSMTELIDERPAPIADVPEEDTGSSFKRLGLSESLLRSIAAVGYEEPSPIQEMTIPVLLAGRDVIAQAQTGSGKTAAFGLPIIESIDTRDKNVQALVLCPTRELAIQVAEALHKYGRHKEVETLPIYGGQPYERQFRGLQRGPQIVVGTPGRVMDHMRRETLNLDHTKFFVLDEADEMLDMGFVEDIEWILQHVPEDRQTALFSATMPARIAQLAATHMNRPERLTVPGKQMTVPETHQIFFEVPRMRKVDALTRILDAEAPPIAMIFCRTKMGVDELGEALLARGYQAETLHGDLSQVQRDRVMRRFRTGQADILIATDVAARGLDIPNVSHVINFDIPESPEAYVHRIGRTGRAGKKGTAVTLVTPRETRWLKQIERTVRARIEGRRLPTAADVAGRRLELLKQQILEVMNDESTYAYYTSVVDDLAEEHDATQVAAALLKLYADETGRGAPAEVQKDDIALVMQPAPFQERPDRGAARPERGQVGDGSIVRLFINAGRVVGVRPQDIVGAIANEAGIPGRSIGAIDIFDAYSLVDVPANVGERVVDALIRSGIKGRPVNAEIARPDAVGGARPDRGPRRDFDRAPGGYDRGPRRDGYRDSNVRPGGPPSFERRPDGDRSGSPPRFSGPREDVPRRYEREDRGNRVDRGPRRDY